MSQKYEYAVVEDNGGGLSLYVFDSNLKVIFSHSGYEYNPGRLSTDLDALDNGTDIETWDGNEENGQDSWDRLTKNEFGWNVVAIDGNGKRKLYPNRMGRAAQIEFGIETE